MDKPSGDLLTQTNQSCKPDVLSNLLAVQRYLTAQGWKVSVPGIYKHRSQGRIKVDRTGRFTHKGADAYARRWLSRIDGGDVGPTEPDPDASAKQAAEIRLRTAQAELHEHKLRVLQGDYVPRAHVEGQMAARAAILRTDMERLCRSEAAELASLAGGDPARASDLAEYMLTRIENLFARYAEPIEFEVPELSQSQEREVKSSCLP